MQMPVIFLTILCLDGMSLSATADLPPGVSEIVFSHGKYSGMPTDDAIKKAKKLFEGWGDSDRKIGTASWDEVPWYTPIDKLGPNTKAQIKHVGILQRCLYHLASKEWSCEPCTAFYVGSKLLFTAAHCVVTRTDTEAKSNPAEKSFDPTQVLMVFVPAFDALKKSAAGLRIVTDWWVPQEFYEKAGANCATIPWGYDFAFLQVDSEKEDKDDFYSLTSPEKVFKAKSSVFSVGYPLDAPYNLRPTRLDYTAMHAIMDEEAKAARGRKPGTLEVVKDYELILPGKSKGVMFRGGSGGPVFPLLQGKSITPAQTREVVGITSWGVGETGKRSPQTVTQEFDLTPVINEAIIKIQGHLRKGETRQLKIVEAVPRSWLATATAWIW